MADLLARYGAPRSAPALDDYGQFVRACFRLDRDDAYRRVLAHPEYLQSPATMFEAARRDRPDVLALLLDLGTPLEIADRTGKRTLHEAAVSNALRAAAFLVERGAEIDPRESTYGGAPIGWAAHGDHIEMVNFLSRHSRYIWTLCFRGYVDRVREVLAERSGRARVATDDGITPLWWLPDDEAKAMEIVELLLAAGADASARSRNGVPQLIGRDAAACKRWRNGSTPPGALHRPADSFASRRASASSGSSRRVGALADLQQRRAMGAGFLAIAAQSGRLGGAVQRAESVRLLLQCRLEFFERLGRSVHLQQHLAEELARGRERARASPPPSRCRLRSPRRRAFRRARRPCALRRSASHADAERR